MTYQVEVKGRNPRTKRDFKASYNITFTKNEDDYGNGIYMCVTNKDGDFSLYDLRYTKFIGEEYQIAKWVESRYGENLVKYSIIVSI